MSLAVAIPGGPLWKDSSLDSAETKLRSQSLQPAGIMMQQQPIAQPAAAGTLGDGLIWQGGSQQTADNFMLSGQPQQQQQSGMSPYVTASGSTLTAAPAGTGRAGCCNDAQTLPEELGSDEADFDMHGLTAAATAAPGSIAHGMAAGAEQQQGAAGGSEPIAVKQFTASSKKQLTSKFRGVCWNRKNKRWQAAINSGGKYIYLGSFTSENDAARQFDRAAIKIRGKKAKLNFPARDYVDENGNLLEEFELPAPAGNRKPVNAGGSSRNAAPKLPSSGTLAHHQQQQQQLEIKPLAVDGSIMQQFSYGGQQTAAAAAAAPDAGWQHHMLMQQQQQQGGQHGWPQQQQQEEQQLWHEQQQNLPQGQLLKARTWQVQLLARQSQQAQAEQQAAASGGGNSSHLLKCKSLPPNRAVQAGVGAAAAPNSDTANQAALILAQHRSGQQMAADGRSSGELHIPAAAAAGQAGSGLQDPQACQPGGMLDSSLPGGAAEAGSFWQACVTVTTSMCFGGNGTGAGGSAAGAGELGMLGMGQDLQQQRQRMLVPELTVAGLDLPPMVPPMPSSSSSAGNAMHMQQQAQQQQQLLSMPSCGVQPSQPQHQQGALWQQQLQSASSNGCPGMPNSFDSTASAAQQYAQQVSMPRLQIAHSIAADYNAGSGTCMTAGPTGPNSSSLYRLGSGGSAHAVSMSAPMQPAAMHQSMQLNSSRLSSLPGSQLASQSSGMGHAPAVTHALSARMASCELGQAFQLARQAAAAQGVTDLTGALRQMSSAQLPVITTSSGSSLPTPQQQQQSVAAGAVLSGGLLQYQGSGLSAGVSSMGGGASGSGPTPLGLQAPAQGLVVSQAGTEQGPAAAAPPGGSTGSPTKHVLTQGCGSAVAAGFDVAAAPASKRARTNSWHDDGPAPSCN